MHPREHDLFSQVTENITIFNIYDQDCLILSKSRQVVAYEQFLVDSHHWPIHAHPV